eukprot:CAMPEP_0180439752 /NCGR_PEP_ID=MMETSP1036_2-20121128/12751_1 /TAXON_ID=632150 /ORGANISM="Azadinium spinosum, Strain 3D9" /LENGTH=56 /DNA_ID=CAMNT_0022445903 /DNA_START=237 /DNA_END=403 /DNA_ORIENTATION=-
MQDLKFFIHNSLPLVFFAPSLARASNAANGSFTSLRVAAFFDGRTSSRTTAASLSA